MDDKYEDSLWGQIDILHQKSRRQHVSFNYFIDMLNKFKEACLDFSKNIQNILNKSHEIIEFHSTTMYDSAEKFVQIFTLFTKELKELQNNIKKQIVEPIFKTTNIMFNKENEFYSIYNDFRNKYNNSKVKLEKFYQNYINSMKLCENLIFNSKQMDLMIYAAENEKIKNLKNANNSIKNTKPVEEKYIAAIDKTNKDRENEIINQIRLLQFYQKLDTTFYEKVNMGIQLYLSFINKMTNSILSSSKILGESLEKVSIEKDINDYISKNKGQKKIQEGSKFIPYKPFSDPTIKKEEPNKLDIYFEVLKTLRNNFKDIRLDIDMEEEEKRKRLRYLCQKIFKIGNNISFSKEEKNQLLEFLEKQSFKKYFIVALTKQRTKGRFKRSESLVHDLSDLLLKILEIAEKEKDFESAKNCIILSQTYFYEEKIEDKKKTDNNDTIEPKKKYLYELIKSNKWLNSYEFWDGLVALNIEEEIEKNQEANKKQGIQDNEKTIQTRLSNICFSQLLTFSSNMMEFGMVRKDAEKIVVKYTEKYNITKELIDIINANIETKQQELDNKNKVNKNDEIKERNDINKENLESKNKNIEIDKKESLKNEEKNDEITGGVEKNQIYENILENINNENKEISENINEEIIENINEENKENKIEENKKNKNDEIFGNKDIGRNKNEEKVENNIIIENKDENNMENKEIIANKNDENMENIEIIYSKNRENKEILENIEEEKEENMKNEMKNYNNNLDENIEKLHNVNKDKENLNENKDQNINKEEENKNNEGNKEENNDIESGKIEDENHLEKLNKINDLKEENDIKKEDNKIEDLLEDGNFKH